MAKRTGKSKELRRYIKQLENRIWALKAEINALRTDPLVQYYEEKTKRIEDNG
jgi:hypothetical protein